MTTTNDDFSGDKNTTGKLQVGGSVNGKFEAAWDSDWFKITLVAGRTYLFAPSVRGVSLAMHAPGSSAPTENLYFQESADPARIGSVSYRAMVSGDYFISIRGDAALGNYSLSATDSPDDYAAPVDLSFGISPGTSASTLSAGASLDGRLMSNNDVDGFALSVTAGLLYRLTLQEEKLAAGLDRNNTGLEVYGINDTLTFTGSGTTKSTTFAPSETKIMVAAVGRSANPGKYSIKLEQLADDFSASKATTGKVAAGGTVSGKFDTGYDVDWFAVTLDASKSYRYSVDGAGAANSLRLALFDADGNTAQVKAFSPERYFSPAKSGTYYIAVGGSGTEGSYQLAVAAVTDEAPNGSTAFPVLAPGGQLAGKIDFAHDSDTFSFAAQQGYLYSFNGKFVGNYDNVGAVYRISLTGPDGQQLVVSGNDTLMFRAGLAGQYRLTIDANPDFYTDVYSLPSYTLSASSGVADDVGVTDTSAKAFLLNSHVTGKIDADGDADLYSSELVAGQTYTFAIDDRYMGVKIIDANGNTVASDWYKTSFTASSSGIYRFLVYAETGHSNPYGFTLTTVHDAIAADISTTGKLVVGGTTTGQLDGFGDADWYAFALEAGQSIEFQGKMPDFNGDWGLALRDSAGHSIGSTSAFNYSYASLLYTPGKSGNYFLQVSGAATGAYNIVSTLGAKDDYANEAGEATSIVAGQVLSGHFSDARDIDAFNISLLENHYYRVDVTLSDANHGDLAVPYLGYFIGAPWTNHAAFKATESGTTAFAFKAANAGGAANYTFTYTDLGLDSNSSTADVAGKVGLGPAVGALEALEDWDVFSVHLLKDERYAFVVQDMSGAPGTHGLSFNFDYLRDFGFWTEGQKLVFSPLTEGDYVFRVGSHSPSSPVPYVFRVMRDSDDHQAPALATFSAPTASAGNDADVRLHFSETVVRDTGTIRVLDGAGHLYTSFVPVSDARAVANGSDVTLDTKQPYYPGTKYTVELGAGSLSDGSGNLLAATSLSFTTAAAAPASDKADLLTASGNGAAIDGRGGVDTVYYQGAAAGFHITRSGATTQVASGATHDTLSNVERLLFTSGDAIALDIDGTGGKAYRLYQAAFNRAPDKPGVSFWMDFMDKGMSAHDVAQFFLTSPEFLQAYGSGLSDAQFIDQLYLNVLHRPGEAGGVAFWNEQMAKGLGRADVLNFFSESPENVATVATIIGNGFPYTPVY